VDPDPKSTMTTAIGISPINHPIALTASISQFRKSSRHRHRHSETQRQASAKLVDTSDRRNINMRADHMWAARFCLSQQRPRLHPLHLTCRIPPRGQEAVVVPSLALALVDTVALMVVALAAAAAAAAAAAGLPHIALPRRGFQSRRSPTRSSVPDTPRTPGTLRILERVGAGVGGRHLDTQGSPSQTRTRLRAHRIVCRRHRTNSAPPPGPGQGKAKGAAAISLA
jgi:hypothetical protein